MNIDKKYLAEFQSTKHIQTRGLRWLNYILDVIIILVASIIGYCFYPGQDFDTNGVFIIWACLAALASIGIAFFVFMKIDTSNWFSDYTRKILYGNY